MIQLMKSAVINERFVVVSENLSYKNVLFMIADALKKDRPAIRINKFMAAFIWRFEYLRSKITLSSPLLSRRTAKSALSNHPYTAKKIKTLLEFEFEPIEKCITRITTELKS